ncbi:MAG: helix-turn-helix domain-containing protein [Acidobacteria bacterium]|nr:helix-turn-helix domain-containing protein [Acidobacteriota bacterium]
MAAIARSLCVTRQAVHRWAQQYRRQGAAGWRRRPRRGRPISEVPATRQVLPKWEFAGARGSGTRFKLTIPKRIASNQDIESWCVMCRDAH